MIFMARTLGILGAQPFPSLQLKQKGKSHSREEVPTLLFTQEPETDSLLAFHSKAFLGHISAVSLSESMFVLLRAN